MNLPNVCMLSSLRSSSSDLNGNGASSSSSSLSVPHLYLNSLLSKSKEKKTTFFLLSQITAEAFLVVVSVLVGIFPYPAASLFAGSAVLWRFTTQFQQQHSRPELPRWDLAPLPSSHSRAVWPGSTGSWFARPSPHAGLLWKRCGAEEHPGMCAS